MKNYIPSLNGLRAISIMMVICCHTRVWSITDKVDYRYSFFFNGDLGVNIFFAISGFLITTLLMEEEQLKGKISFKNFYARRTLRIFPAFYFLLLVYFILQCFGVLHIHLNSWITSITYTKYFHFPDSTDLVTGHFWSLSVEEHFYLLWPLIFSVFKKYRVKIALAIIILIPIIRIWQRFDWEAAYTLYHKADSLMIGCMFALYKDSILKYINKAVSYSKVVIYLPVLMIIILHYIEAISNEFNLHLGYFFVPFGALGTFGSVSIGLLILITINFEKNLMFKFLNTPVMNYIGKLSYSLYLWQELFFSKDVKFFSIFPYNLAFIFIAACISYYLVERPFLKLKVRYERV